MWIAKYTNYKKNTHGEIHEKQNIQGGKKYQWQKRPMAKKNNNQTNKQTEIPVAQK